MRRKLILRLIWNWLAPILPLAGTANQLQVVWLHGGTGTPSCSEVTGVSTSTWGCGAPILAAIHCSPTVGMSEWPSVIGAHARRIFQPAIAKDIGADCKDIMAWGGHWCGCATIVGTDLASSLLDGKKMIRLGMRALGC